jgi:hypothetical protein
MAQAEFITYRLLNGKKRGGWQLGIKGMMAPDKNGYLKKVQYVPGSDSIFKEDHKGDEKPVSPWFEDGLLKVHKNNKPLLEIIKIHKGYNKDFEVVDEDREAEKELAQMELQEKALAKVNVSDEMEVRANGILLMGQSAVSMSEKVVRMMSKKMAFKEPQKLLDVFNAGDYHGKYIAALSVLRGVVLVNQSRTAVTWPDGKAIVTVAAGQDPIIKLGLYLSGNDEQAVITLQTLGEAIKRSYVRKQEITGEDHIEAIRGAHKVENELDLPKAPFSDYVSDEDVELTIEEARDNYRAKFNVDVANNKKNDLDWIKSKLQE